MNHLYVLLINTYHEWEDTVIFTTEQEAIDVSLKYSNIRVDFFSKNGLSGYSPRYNYYKNGKLIKNSSDN
jgi:hypothetical protein